MRVSGSVLRLLSLLLLAGMATAVPDHVRALPDVSSGPARRSLLIIENAGQWHPAVRFQARSAGMTLWVTDDSLWITKVEPRSPARTGPDRGALGYQRDPLSWTGVNLHMRFSGRSSEGRLVATDPRPTRMNYFLGSDPKRWRSGVRTYGAVTWRDLYPGTSVTLTESGGEPALVLQGLFRPEQTALRMRVAGAQALRAASGGRLVADTAVGPVPLPAVSRGGRWLAAHVAGTEVYFTTEIGMQATSSAAVPGERSGLRYSTFLGGSDNEFPEEIAAGPDGSTYVTGITHSADFPTTAGAFDTTFADGDAFISKLDPTGSMLLYSTFLGGSSSGDSGRSLAIGPLGVVYVGGGTGSEDFPVTPGAYDTTLDGGDGFVTQLDAQGAALVYSTFIGGTSNDGVEALALASDGTVHLAGDTFSADFPTTPGAFDHTINNDGLCCLYLDAFAAALNPAGTDLVYGTYLGGRYNDHGYGVAVGPGGGAYVTGPTQSFDFPTTPGAFDETSNGGNHDAFVTKLAPDGTALAFSTYLGGNETDDAYEVAVDRAGNAYVAGFTASPNYPTTPGAYDTTINSFIFTDVFATKLEPTGSSLVYSTFLGGEGVDSALDLSLDTDGSLSVTGNTRSANFPTTPGAFDRTLGGCCDAFVARFGPTGSALLYSSFLGGTGRGDVDQGAAVASASPGIVAAAGVAVSADFPVTPGAYDTTINGGADGFVATLRVAPAMHVEGIVPWYRPVGPGYAVGAGIRILYQNGYPVEGADVTVEIRSPDGAEVLVTRPTGPRGVAVVARPASDSGTYTFTVLDVTRLGPVYDPSQNAETSDSVTIP